MGKSCPHCKGPMREIVYGTPGPELAEAADRGEVELGGCVVGPHQPASRCLACGAFLRDHRVVTTLTVAFWNRHYHRRPGPQVELLVGTPWDVALLVEVDRPMARALREAFGADQVRWALDQVEVTDMKRPHGVAVVARKGASISELELPAASDPNPAGIRPERFADALVTLADGRTISTLVFHAPFAAGGAANRERKRLGYELLTAHLEGRGVWPLVLGMDGNNWLDQVRLTPPQQKGDAWDCERRFHGGDPSHKLRDALRDYVCGDDQRLAAAEAAVAEGRTMAATYRRRDAWDRMDRIYVSPDIAVSRFDTHYDAARAAASDHALVVAELRVH